jgi:hypothetical protein
VIAARQAAADRLARAVAQEQASVIAVEGVTEGGVDADTRRAAGEDERVDPAAAQDRVQVGLEEAAVAVLRDDDVSLLRRELREDLSPQVPRINVRLTRPSGISPASPTPSALCLRKLGASGDPASERSGSNCIVRYTTVMPARRATGSNFAIGSMTASMSAIGIPARANMPSRPPKSFCMSTTTTAVAPGSIARASGLASIMSGRALSANDFHHRKRLPVPDSDGRHDNGALDTVSTLRTRL